MKPFSPKSFLPYITVVVLFLILSFVYFSPVLEGKIILGHDNVSYLSASKEAVDYEAETGERALWTNAMFGGMPTYQITGDQPYNLVKYIEAPLKAIPRPVFFAFLYLLGGFLLLKMLGMKTWLSAAGAIALAFASYNFIIIAAGHNTKAIAIAYMMPLLGSIIMSFRGKRYWGAALTALFLALAIRANHLQILYYTLFVVIIYFISELVFAIKEKRFADLMKTSGVLVVAALLAIAANAGTLMTTYEYGKYTMRGDATGLTLKESAAQDGLDAEYITQWSYGIDETMTLLIPNYMGGASGGALDLDSETANHLKSENVPEAQIEQIVAQMPLYWGEQLFTSGPVYLGAIVCFLFVLALFLVEGRQKYWLLAATLLSFLLAWGWHFMSFSQFFIDYIPLYNKFRAVSMTLVIAGVCMPILGILALKKIFDGSVEDRKLKMSLIVSTAIVGGICLLFALIPSLAGNFVSPNDARQFTGDYAFLQTTLPIDRATMLSADAWRSLLFVVLAAAVLFVFLQYKIKTLYAVAALGLLFLLDLYPVAKRYLNDDNFVDRETLFAPVHKTAADKAVMADKDPNFRVLDLTKGSPFEDATASYFHKNIGGYSAVKMRRYQELIDFRLQPEMEALYNAFQTIETEDDLNRCLQDLQVLNMLNMKYLIINPEMPPIANPFANGNAWFVENLRFAGTANEEMEFLGNIDTKKEMVLNNAAGLPDISFNYLPDSLAQIHQTAYSPNKLTYSFQSTTPQFVVFSEIYYDKGWKAYVDDKETPYFRANYVLRAMQVPAGEHRIEFRFEPESYRIGNLISLIASSLLLLSLLAAIALLWKKKREK
jgi:hypothetical protein